ncbi:MAG TPA: hypothetical protein VKM94_26495 [Blastocatellia bacterium]|nr:hypothetical protein [Blastocatellia bacterium]
MTTSVHTVRTPRLQREWIINYTQGDVDLIRSQIIEGEALKRRWLVLGLILVSGGLVGTLMLLITSLAAAERADNARRQFADQNVSLSRRADDLQKTVDTRNAEDAERARAAAQTEESYKRLATSIVGNSDVSLSGGRFAQQVYRMGGSVKLESKPSEKLFRNWKVNTGSTSEVYSVVGGFLDGKWLVYSSLISRREAH